MNLKARKHQDQHSLHCPFHDFFAASRSSLQLLMRSQAAQHHLSEDANANEHRPCSLDRISRAEQAGHVHLYTKHCLSQNLPPRCISHSLHFTTSSSSPKATPLIPNNDNSRSATTTTSQSQAPTPSPTAQIPNPTLCKSVASTLV